MSASRVRFAPAQGPALIKAVMTLFFINGLVMGAWVGALPGLRQRVGTDTAGIGLLLVIAGLGAIVSMQVAGYIADRRSARGPALVGVGVIALGELVVSWADSLPILAIGALLVGSGNGGMGVAMNALGVDAEAAADRRVMSRLHSMASFGGFAGAFVIFAVARVAGGQHGDPREALWATAGVTIAVTALLVRWAPRPTEFVTVVAQQDGVRRRVPRRTWLLGAMALLFGFTEGAAVDWSSIHVTAVGHVSPAVGATGLICVTLSMVSVRFFGDRVVNRWGSAATLRYGTPLALVGFAVTSTAHVLVAVLLGWLLVGFGVALAAPQIYGIAGRLGGGRTLALVSGFGYAAFLTGPGIIGWVAARVGIQHAMFLPAVTSLLLAGMTQLPVVRRVEG